MMKILYIVPYVPSLIRVRPYNLIRSLTKIGHEVTVATLWSSEDEREDTHDLSNHCHAVHGVMVPKSRSYLNSLMALPTRMPLQAVFSWSPDFIRLLDELEPQNYDVIHVEHLRGVRYALYLREKYPEIPIVWDSVDCISLLFRWASQRSKSFFSRMLTRFELGRTERYEGRLVKQFKRVLVTSPIDQKALLELANLNMDNSNVQVLTNGVDLEYFQPDQELTLMPETVVITGKMSYHANITMAVYLAEEIMPIVWNERPGVQLEIVGKDPSPEVLKLGEHKNVTVIGEVPDLRPYIQKATVAAAPILYGVGIQNKVLEAMACGTPVVVTPQAVSAIDVKDGQEVMVGEDPQTFAEKILELMRDPVKRTSIGKSGREYVTKHHKWSQLAEDLSDIYMQVRN